MNVLVMSVIKSLNFCTDACGSRKTVLQVDWAEATRERFYLWSFAMAHGLMD